MKPCRQCEDAIIPLSRIVFRSFSEAGLKDVPPLGTLVGDDVRKLVIIGSGPAGYTAGLYASRALLDPLMFAGYMSGGQLMLTSEVENFPGYPKGIGGPEMMIDMREQAERFGLEVQDKNVERVDLSQRPFGVWVEGEEFKAESLIICTGAEAIWLGAEGEEGQKGRGISTCATCDGAFFRDEEIIVVGGGDSAMEEATFLTKFASEVVLVHRREEFRASKIMVDRALSNPKISVEYNSIVEDILGSLESGVTAVLLKDTKTGDVREMLCDGVFMAIGHVPNTQLFNGSLNLNDAGYIVTQPDSTHTNIEGVFACGDVQDQVYRQAVTAAGTGCMAAIDAERWLEQ